MLVVTREPLSLRPLWAIGEANCWRLETASSGWQALESVQSGATPDLIVLDLTPGDPDSLHTLRWLRRIRPDLPVVLISHNGHPEQKQEAMRLGAQEYLVRPVDEHLLEIVIQRYASSGAEKVNLDSVAEEIEQIGDGMFFVAASAKMRKLRAQAELLAQVDSPVLILGENGSGKELVARLIHKLSVRSGFRFFKVNCGALSPDLLESEVFGRDPGVAGNVRVPGKLELCHQGTLFLDEITKLPMSLQTKLLRVLPETQARPGNPSQTMQGRILAATSLPVEQVVAERRLRQDLYYRLSAFTLHVPPLCQRADDIPLLLGHLMNQLARRYSLPVRTISPTLLEACQRHSWPGNLTELQNFVKCYLVTGDEDVALSELERAPQTGSETPYAAPAWGSMGHGGAENGEFEDSTSSLKSLVQSAKGVTERTAIAGALSKTHWNRKAAARLLKVSYRTLLYKIEQYRMSPPVGHFSGYGNVGGLKNGQHS